MDECGCPVTGYKGIYRRRNLDDYTLQLVAATGVYPGQTASSMHRLDNFLLDEGELSELKKIRANGDKINLVLALNKGYVHTIDRSMSAYRKVTTSGDSWSAKTHNMNMNGVYFAAELDIKRYFDKFYPNTRYPNCYFIARNAVSAFIKMVIRPNEENVAVFRKIACELGGFIPLTAFIVKMLIVGLPYSLRYRNYIKGR